jgi:hypothetical protein
VKFFRNLILLTVVISIVIGILIKYSGFEFIHPLIWYTLGFFVLISGFTYYLTQLGHKNDPDNFQVYYFASMGFRFILSLGVIVLYIFFYEEGRLQFVFNFFALYFLFIGFEIYSLLANLRPHLKKQD